jgi:hypothetical protein
MSRVSQPVDYVLALLKSKPVIREVELSAYTNFPESLLDVRTSEWVHRGRVLKRFEQWRTSLSGEQELAFHSRVRVATKDDGVTTRHIPLVDFKTSDRTVVEKAAGNLVDEQHVADAALFASGRSYHLYLDVLLSPAEWVKFMGRLLLLNPRVGPAVVDSRWIGHRMMSGFAALRWTANTIPYTAPPQLVRRWGKPPREWSSENTPELLRQRSRD